MYSLWAVLEFFLIAGIISASSVGKVSNQPEKEATALGIIHGKKVPITKYPFTVAIEASENVSQGSGVILNENYILTTAYMTEYDWKIRVGSKWWRKGGRVVKCTSVLIHPQYQEDHWSYNVALYKTNEPIKFNKRVQPVEIGTDELKAGTRGTVVGWGDKARYTDPSNVLRKAENTIINFKDCNVTYSPDVDNTNFCTQAEEAGPCVGDFGDPFIVEGKVYGLYAGGYDCTNQSRVYVNIPALADWIKQNTQP